MNKKTIFKIIILLAVGSIFGALFTLGLLKLNESEFMSIGDQVAKFFINNTSELHVGLIICIYFPAVYLYFKGKKFYSQLSNKSDEEFDEFEKVGSKSFDLAMLISNVFLILNFMLFGMTFNNTNSNQLIVTCLFMFSTIAVSVLNIITIKYIQKNDNRLKGDPTSFRFDKEFLESCDEAQVSRIYKSGYRAFQFSKNVSLVFVILTILLNFTFNTGAFPVFVTCMIMLIQVTSYNYYAMKNEK
ncbi:DUF3169 family protein [Clostridium sp.]|uniref:DUF3169 family protein n=1 Tax=Clostridium sp. TaxID=1506 RepID=UPI001A5D6FE8|nr:DUF3169 family protein [Clostridium sp.]MBK5236617.1 DUF3169 family protein [Clostridium sp.]